MKKYTERKIRFLVIFCVILFFASCQTTNNINQKTKYNDIIIISNDVQTIIDGDNIVSVKKQEHPTTKDQYMVIIKFDDYAKEIIKTLTTKYLGKKMSIFVAETELITATVMEPIADGMVCISGMENNKTEKILNLILKEIN